VKYDGSGGRIQQVVTATVTTTILTTAVASTIASTTITSTTISQTASGQVSGVGPGLAFVVIMIGVGTILAVAGLAFALSQARRTYYPTHYPA
jgi:hypothetical protein